jgi:hypothetical protein
MGSVLAKAVAAALRGALAVLLVPACAWAFDTSGLGQGGSLPLDDRMALIAKNPKLKQEVTEALAKIGKKSEDIICSGMRFPGSWRHLGGARVAPYTCDFQGKWLQIRADVRLTDKSGKVYDKITPAAMRNAEHVSETNLTWKWTTEDPDK